MRILPQQRSVMAASILVLCCLGMSGRAYSDGPSGGVRKSRSTKSAKAITARSLDGLLKSKSEESWEKGLGRGHVGIVGG